MSQEDILASTKSVIQGLDALKNEHGKMLDSIVDSIHSGSPLNSSLLTDTNKLEAKAGLLRKSMDMIELGKTVGRKRSHVSLSIRPQGIGEAQVMMQLGYHLQNIEAEKHKLRTQVKRLCQENAWLREELAASHKKLHECEQANATYAVEIEHLKFLKDMKQYDPTENNNSSFSSSSTKIQQSCNQPTQPSSPPNADLVNDLFPNDDDSYADHQNDFVNGTSQSRRFGSYADLFMSPSQSGTGSFISTAGYEVPARLKTLHNLVIQYASQGRYEVAVPLCRQALEDLERTSGHQRKSLVR